MKDNTPNTLIVTPKGGKPIEVKREGEKYTFGGKTVIVSEGTKISIKEESVSTPTEKKQS